MQVFLPDNLPNIAVASTTSISLAAVANGLSTTATIGGQQYALTSALTLSTGTTGAGGLDTGSLGSIQLWYVYLIANSTTFAPALIASLAPPATGPSIPGAYFAAYKLVGAFYTNGTSLVGSVVSGIYTQATTAWMTYTPAVVGLTGTIASSGWWRRNGDSLEFSFKISKDATAPTGSTTSTATLPAGLSIDTTKTSIGNLELAATNSYYQSGTANNKDVTVNYAGASAPITLQFARTNSTTAFYNSGNFEASAFLISYGVVPISGWNATLI